MTIEEWGCKNGYRDCNCCDNCAFLVDDSIDEELTTSVLVYCSLMKEDGVQDYLINFDEAYLFICDKWQRKNEEDATE
jgi:hypothetical protein